MSTKTGVALNIKKRMINAYSYSVCSVNENDKIHSRYSFILKGYDQPCSFLNTLIRSEHPAQTLTQSRFWINPH